MGPDGQRQTGTRQAGKQPRTYLVYTGERHLADRMAGTCPERAIENIRTTPDIDGGKLTVETTVNNPKANDRIEVKVLDGNKVIASGSALNHTSVEIPMPADCKLWSPDSPSLYDLEISFYADGKLQDKVKSYTAMRKFSTRRDEKGTCACN